MHLNADQKLALEQGQPVPLLVADRACILILKDAYEDSQNASVEETYAAVDEVLKADDDPGLDYYQQIKR